MGQSSFNHSVTITFIQQNIVPITIRILPAILTGRLRVFFDLSEFAQKWSIRSPEFICRFYEICGGQINFDFNSREQFCLAVPIHHTSILLCANPTHPHTFYPSCISPHVTLLIPYHTRIPTDKMKICSKTSNSFLRLTRIFAQGSIVIFFIIPLR